MTNDQMREAFEAWYSNDGEWPQAVEHAAGQYLLTTATTAWRTWQAGVAYGMERAAVICDRTRSVSAVSYETGAACADAIRAEIPGDCNV
ncbi:hypothetical protein [Cupriavidus gilardii]|uniref:hypothetical protein n=1 Tax=Cupriavidus gilardii TaxID=82541 RepID=UPI0021BF3543|nr:hypothetical protein [Cupriavidus gilardii]MCT9125362.1 hypothetical protein [Cupriavidus gilardii]